MCAAVFWRVRAGRGGIGTVGSLPARMGQKTGAIAARRGAARTMGRGRRNGGGNGPTSGHGSPGWTAPAWAGKLVGKEKRTRGRETCLVRLTATGVGARQVHYAGSRSCGQPRRTA